MPIEDSAPNEAECITIGEGLIKCMRTMNEECMRQYGKELSEEDIQEIMRTGKHEDFLLEVSDHRGRMPQSLCR